ncbi:MAG: ATP-binding protein [Thermoproteota archaeon]
MIEVKRILVDQRSELEDRMNKERIVEREFLSSFRKVAASSLIKVTTGIRRTGKSFSTYLILKPSEFGYVNFDEPLLLTVTPEEILSALIEIYGDVKIIFLDEVQNLKDWELFVNRLHRGGYNVFITGSNAKLLSSELATHLTGRHVPIEVFPFSFREYLKSKGFKESVETTRGISLIKHEFEKYIETGGFPEVVVKGESPKTYLRQLYNDIVEKDIIIRHNIAYRTTFREIALTMLSNFGRYVTYNSLKRQFGLRSDHTSKNYLSYLNESYLVLFINKLSPKPREVETGPKKIYCIDSGMIRSVGVSWREDLGRLIENLVAIELLRRRSYWFKEMEIYYWKNYEQYEVDFVIKKGLSIQQLIQVTYASRRMDIEKRELKALVKASEQLGCRNLLVLTWDYEGEEEIEGRKVKHLPLWKWLLRT